MAHAILKTTGNMAACVGTVGPGAMNLVPGVAAAWADNIPLLAITELMAVEEAARFRQATSKYRAEVDMAAEELNERTAYSLR